LLILLSVARIADISDRISDKMAHIIKRGNKYRAEVCIERQRRAKTFQTKREAVAWANEQESHGILAHKTLLDLIADYTPIAEAHKGAQSEKSRLTSLKAAKWKHTPLEQVTSAMITEWRDTRLKKVSPVSVRREMIILSAMFRLAINEWGWMRDNPMATVKRPATSAPRRRGVAQSEIDAILSELAKMRRGVVVSAMFRLSIETGMRLSEIVGIRWEDVAEKSVTLPQTKNGDRRQVPLSVVAREIVKGREGLDDDYVFPIDSGIASKTFQRARTLAKCDDVHFHDARSEAITRLSKKLDVMQLARMIGHRDLKSLMIYYAESADSMADRL
jgi:integrase